MIQQTLKDKIRGYKKNPKLIGSLVALGGGVYIAGMVIAKSIVPAILPQLFVAEAFKNTHKVIGKELNLAKEKTGRALYSQIMKSEAVQTDFELQLQSIAGKETETINRMIRGMGLSGQIKNDQKAYNLQGKLALNQNSLEMIGAEFYKNGSEVGLTVPKIFQYTAVDLDTLIEDYYSSSLFELMGQPIDEEAYKLTRDYFESYKKERFSQDLIERMTQRSEEAFKQAKIVYKGKTIDYRVYELTLGESEVKSYLKELFALCIEEGSLKEYVEAMHIFQGDYEGKSQSTEEKSIIDAFNKSVDAIEDLSFKAILAIDESKRIVEASLGTTAKIDQERIETVLEISLLGDSFITDEIKISLDMKNQIQRAGLSFISRSNYGTKENQLQHQMLFEVSEEGLPLINMQVDMAYNRDIKDNYLKIETEIKTPRETLFAGVAEGVMLINKGSSKIELVMNSITLDFLGNDKEYTLNLSGKYALKGIKPTELTFYQGDVKDLFDMTQDELIGLMEKASDTLRQVEDILQP